MKSGPSDEISAQAKTYFFIIHYSAVNDRQHARLAAYINSALLQAPLAMHQLSLPERPDGAILAPTSGTRNVGSIWYPGIG